MSSSLSVRKLDDYADNFFFFVNPTRMRKNQTVLPPSSCSAHSSRTRSSPDDSTRLQFFVRMFSDRTLVLQAQCTDTIKTIHEKIQSITGFPIIEPRLIYGGKQLQWDRLWPNARYKKMQV